MYTIEDVEKWEAENLVMLETGRTKCSAPEVQTINKLAPEFSRKMWNSSVWMAHMLDEHGATDEQITNIQFAHGQRCLGSDPYQVALAYVNEFVKTKNVAEKPGEELAQKIYKEIISE